MRRLTILLSFSLFLICAQAVRAAQLQYSNGGFSTQCGYEYNHAYLGFQDSTSARSGPTASICDVSDSISYTEGQGFVNLPFAFDEGIQVWLASRAQIFKSDPYLEDYSAYGDSETTQPMWTGGIFFVVKANGPTERTGDPVRIDFDWWYHSYPDGGTVSFCPLNGFSNMYVTVNSPFPLNEDPAPDTVVWSHGEITLDYADWGNETGSFEARIGDVIGVFMGARASLESYGAAEAFCSAEMWMDLAVTTLPFTAADVDLDRNGRIDLGDLAILAEFWLEDVIL